MKQIMFALVVVLFSCVVFSQDTIQDRVIFGNRTEPTKVSFYGSFDFAYQQLLDEHLEDPNSFTVGVRLGVVLNKNIVFGIWGYTNTDNLYNNYLDTYLRYGGGGLLIEPRIFPKFWLHLNLPIKAGFGTISYADNDWSYYNISAEDDLTRDRYLIFEPGAEVVFNVVRYFKISGGVSYKFTDQIILIDTPNNILNGWTYNLTYKIVYP